MAPMLALLGVLAGPGAQWWLLKKTEGAGGDGYLLY